jgi:regulator of replication initiation timing
MTIKKEGPGVKIPVESAPQGADIKTLEQVQAENDALKLEIESLHGELEDATVLIKELSERKSLDNLSLAVISLDGKEYAVTAGFKTKKGLFTPKDIAGDESLCRSLLAKNSTILKAI